VQEQLESYLADPRFPFTLPLAHAGTAFRQRVRAELTKIPVGESRTYGEIARALHTAPRAVGGACGGNPIALVVPCHRVVGSRGSLGGFMNAADGDPLAIKRWLLAHEGYRFGA
jgi:methylated-DNA-[protein]-cysteine S-methyltransferase